MRAIIFLVTCLAILIATSCGDKAVTPNQLSETETQIVGNWFWLESCGGFAGKCISPSVIGSDGVDFSKEGKIYYWCDVCTFPKLLDYKIEQKTSGIYGPDTIVTVIVITGDEQVSPGLTVQLPDLIIKHLDDSGLTVQEDCIDCYESVYSKNQ